MESGATNGPYALARPDEITVYAIKYDVVLGGLWVRVHSCWCIPSRYLPMITLTWPEFMPVGGRIKYVQRVRTTNDGGTDIDWQIRSFESNMTQGRPVNVGL